MPDEEKRVHENAPVPPVAAEERVADWPESMVSEVGCVEIEGATLTVTVTVLENTKGEVVPVSVTFNQTT